MRRIVVLFFLLSLVFSFQTARAQGTPKLTSVDVWVWPEYDQPSVLVIYHILVSPETTLPATMIFRIPAAAIKPNAVAVGQVANSVTDVGVQYSLEPAGDWININLQVTGPAIQLEYYDPTLTKQGKNRELVYQWPGDYAVDNFRVELQQPFDASQMVTVPVLGDVTNIPNDLTYHVGNFGPFQAGESFTLKVNYQKQTDELSVSAMPVQSSAPVDANTAGRVSLGTYMPWLIAGVGVLLAAGGSYYYFRGQSRPRQIRRRHDVPIESTEGPKYCPQCGTRARPGDRFCRTCGTRMRQGPEE
jgi:hypothetical protein